MSDEIQDKANKLVQDEALSDEDFLSVAKDRFRLAMVAVGKAAGGWDDHLKLF